MNSALARYFCLNQLLMGTPLDSLHVTARELLEKELCDDLYAELLSRPRKIYDNVEQVFLNFLRMSAYDYCIPASSRQVLTLRQVIDFVRRDDIDPAQVNHWASACLKEVNSVECGSAKVEDGVVTVSREFLSREYNIDQRMKDMFALRCWASVAPTADHKFFIRSYCAMHSHGAATVLSQSRFKELLEAIEHTGMHPTMFSTTALNISDMAPLFALTGVLAQYVDTSCKLVNLMVDAASDNKMYCVNISFPDFVKECGVDGHGLSSAVVKNGSLVTKGVRA